MRNISTIIVGILVGVLFLAGTALAHTGLTGVTHEDLTIAGVHQTHEDVYHGYLTSTNVVLVLPDFWYSQYNTWNIWYETSSGVYKWEDTVTYSDNDSDGWYDRISFTATSGATTGGECWIHLVEYDGI